METKRRSVQTGSREEGVYGESGETVAQVAQGLGGAPALETFEVRPEGAVSNLISLKVSPPRAGWLD